MIEVRDSMPLTIADVRQRHLRERHGRDLLLVRPDQLLAGPATRARSTWVRSSTGYGARPTLVIEDVSQTGRSRSSGQHVGRPASRAPRPARCHHPRPVRAAHYPGPGTAPASQPARATRTRQPARTEPLLDHHRVDLYRDHRASERTARPSRSNRPRTRREGRALRRRPAVVTVASVTNEINTPRLAPPPSSRPTAPSHYYVVVFNGG